MSDPRIKKEVLIDKAIDKILDAQVIISSIQGREEEKKKINFYANRVSDCMELVRKLENKKNKELKP